MGKSLYSLILSDEVVREVDLLAHRRGTSRSNLINQILAEYVDFTTPERRINDILCAVEQLMRPSQELVAFFTPNTQTMSLKSSLEYKYRPTVKYEIELYRQPEDALGELSVVFRTQSAALIGAMSEFFGIWKAVEDAHLRPRLTSDIGYKLYDGRFVRTIAVPQCEYGTDDFAAALSDYITLFDTLMKQYLAGRLSPHDIEVRCVRQLDACRFYI